jgi:hypothetical protein
MRSLRCLFGITNVILLAACAVTTDGEETGETESAVAAGETVTLPTGTVPRKLVVTTAAAQCPISTDCSRSWTDRFVDTVFKQHDPDIVIMTELFWNGSYRNMVDQVGKVRPGVYNFYRGPKEGFIDGSGGTVIASKYVMTNKAEHEFTTRIKPDSYVDKGLAIARQKIGVLADGQPVDIDVLATHMQSKTIGVFGNFTNVQRAQLGETERFLRAPGLWGQNGGNGTPNTTLKIFSGDLNFAGSGPGWLGDDKVAAGKANFNWLRDNILLPYGFRDGTDACSGGIDASSTCTSRAFVEKETYEVMKQFHVPYAKFAPNAFVKPVVGAKKTERGMYMVPQSQQTFSSGSDHEAKQITYALYVVTKQVSTGVESTERRKVDGGGPPPHEEQ